MTPEQNIAAIEFQISQCEKGESDVIVCPYCRAENWKPGVKPASPNEGRLCCDLFAKAALAIIERQSVQEFIDHAQRIADKAVCN